MTDQLLQVTYEDTRTSGRWVRLTESGGLSLEGQDLTATSEYEFATTLSKEQTATPRRLLGVDDDDGDLLAAVAGQFSTLAALEAFLKQHDLRGTFWSRHED